MLSLLMMPLNRLLLPSPASYCRTEVRAMLKEWGERITGIVEGGPSLAVEADRMQGDEEEDGEEHQDIAPHDRGDIETRTNGLKMM